MPENTVTVPLARWSCRTSPTPSPASGRGRPGTSTSPARSPTPRWPEFHRLLLDVAARVFIPVTAVDDCDGEPRAHSFLAAALGRILLEMLCHGVCLANEPGAADTLVRFSENILTEDHGDVPDVLRQLEVAGMEQAIAAAPGAPDHRVTAPRGRPWCGPARIPGAPPRCAPPVPSNRTAGRTRCDSPASPQRTEARARGRAGSSIAHPLDRDLSASRNRR
ncbi:hypothetical protein [Streptomyces sp. NPDC048266]|uniref:hypothetical protein n=1 Tax=Streptomyces sp. NPDC048266 TaxID=3155787 RepID=UPI003407B28A